ncbi:OB-fold domain-containing protein [Falsiroseomonas sp.]|uniref:OB-fold domain-containing protein n=1 Tax=Falsiroseomonas sp. TaxID=2870721 RepID=UPI002727DE43|nr:OB-fold domain-containing protein [Falsiroseomonas sp.]MDO9500078.1 hypothetical protein [Falsiroseomonas sp.]
MDLREPSLYAPAAAGDGAVLLALRDPVSGALSFPRSPYGPPGLEAVELSGQATLLACITLHQPVLPGVVPPLVVARLQLAEGLVVDGVLEGTAEPPPGTPMRAVLVAEDGALVCRFRPAA